MDIPLQNHSQFDSQPMSLEQIMCKISQVMKDNAAVYSEEIDELKRERDAAQKIGEVRLKKINALQLENIAQVFRIAAIKQGSNEVRVELLKEKEHVKLLEEEKQKPAPTAREAQLEAENEELRKKIQEMEAQLAKAQEGGDGAAVEEDTSWIAQIENKPSLSLGWRLLERAGARRKKRGDTKIINQLLMFLTGHPYDSCKKVWEVGNRPITRHPQDIAKVNSLLRSLGIDIQI